MKVRRGYALVAAVATIAVGAACGDDVGSAQQEAATTTATPVQPTSLASDAEPRPEPVSAGALASRQAAFGSDFRQLSRAIESAEDWSGTVGGWLFQLGDDQPWILCAAVNDSYPPQCATPLILEDVPESLQNLGQMRSAPSYRGFDTMRWLAQGIAMTGTFFHDSAVFRVDSWSWSR